MRVSVRGVSAICNKKAPFEGLVFIGILMMAILSGRGKSRMGRFSLRSGLLSLVGCLLGTNLV